MRRIDIAIISVTILILGISIYTFINHDEARDLSIHTVSLTPKVNITGITLINEFGSEINDVNVNSLVLFQIDITNLQSINQPFICIIKIKSPDGSVNLSYNKSELPSNESITVATSWMPEKVGVYDIDIFIWDDLNGREVLTHKKSLKIDVKD